MFTKIFRNRIDAGQFLASKLTEYANRPDVMVLALPRGGVPVAYEVAQKLHAPLDIFVVRKLGVPGHEELAMGAVASGGVRVLNPDVLDHLRVPRRVLDGVTLDEATELERRERLYRAGRPPPDVRDRIVILVDDGLATGSSMRAAAAALHIQHPARLVVAVPVAARPTRDDLRRRPDVDEVVCVLTPEPFFAVGQWYLDFEQVADKEVTRLLQCSDSSRGV